MPYVGWSIKTYNRAKAYKHWPWDYVVSVLFVLTIGICVLYSIVTRFGLWWTSRAIAGLREVSAVRSSMQSLRNAIFQLIPRDVNFGVVYHLNEVGSLIFTIPQLQVWTKCQESARRKAVCANTGSLSTASGVSLSWRISRDVGTMLVMICSPNRLVHLYDDR
jgi:hypothetical protein